MTKHLSILLFLLNFFLASCEDKESSKKIDTLKLPTSSEEVQKTEDSPEVEDTISEDTQHEKETTEDETSLDIDFPIPQEKLIPTLTKFGEENPESQIRISTEFGNIEVRLHRNTPLHRANFIMLVKEDYFDQTYFHRVAEGFVIQGGNSDNPSTNKKRRAIGSYLIPSEFEAGHSHSRGAFSAAKYSEQNVSKASSPYEFFIVLNPKGAHHLDNDHTVFGRVTKGMDVVDEISKVEVGAGEWPIDNIQMKVEIID